MAKPLKFHQTLNLPPRSMKNGKHRRAGAPAYGDPVVRTDHGAGGTDEDGTVNFTVTGWSTRTVIGADFAEPTAPTIPYAGIRTGEIIGHRLWWVIPEHGEQWLCSLVHRRLWRPGEVVSGNITELVPNCWYPVWGGVYAFAAAERIPEEIKAHLDYIEEQKKRDGGFFIIGWCAPEETSTFVYGTAKMWGDVVEHETGYRAQFAKLHSIDQIFGPGDLDALRRRYGVDQGHEKSE